MSALAALLLALPAVVAVPGPAAAAAGAAAAAPGPAAAAPAAAAPGSDATTAGEQRFLELLRTYPERPPAETFAQVARLIDGGDFPQRDRAEYWIGSARLAAGDRAGARDWFARLARDYPRSAWEQRSWLGLGDALAQEGRYGAALEWYARAQAASDPAVRELGRISAAGSATLRARQRWAIASAAFALAVMAWLALGIRGHLLNSTATATATATPTEIATPTPPPPAIKYGVPRSLPTELRVVWPVLAVLALLSSRVDAAPRGAILQLCGVGAVLVLLSGLRLRAVEPGLRGRAMHAALTLCALGAASYAIIYRADLVGMVLETFRAGPE